jgi:hypothetical protein
MGDDAEVVDNPLASSEPKAEPRDRALSRQSAAKDIVARTDELLQRPLRKRSLQTVMPFIPARHSLHEGFGIDGSLMQGQRLSGSIRAGDTSSLYRAGPFEVQLEFSTSSEEIASDGRVKKLQFSIEWLSAREAERLQEHRAVSIVDAESFDGEVPHALDSPNCLFLSVRKSVLKISLNPIGVAAGG